MSKPIDPLSLFLGWKAGNWVARQRGKVSLKQPFGYIYNGLCLPALHKWDDETYPYVIYTTSGAIASSTPFTTSWRGLTYAVPSTPHLSCKLSWSENGESLSGWEKVDVNGDELLYQYWYTNHDIFKADGTVYCAAHDAPVPVYLPVVMFDGEVATAAFEGYGEIIDYRGEFQSLCSWTVGDVIRVTFNGVTEEHIVRVNEAAPKQYYGGVVGNTGLNDDYPEYDTGEDWKIVPSTRSVSNGQALFRLITRTPGTYQLKIERITIAEATT